MLQKHFGRISKKRIWKKQYWPIQNVIDALGELKVSKVTKMTKVTKVTAKLSF
jgi:hypothetical protein